MGRILYNKSCPFTFWDWNFKNVKDIFAGRSCVMAITNKGDVLQKVLDENLAARIKFWKNIKTISISQVYPALAVGLVNDGTCIVSKKALRNCCSITKSNFEYINEQIKSLKNIVEIAVSDAVFALDSYGRVYHIPLCRTDEYTEVDTWNDICHITVGSQCSLFGITKNGTVVCAGRNTTNACQKNIRDIYDAIDICALGSECEKVIVALLNGKVIDLHGNDLNIEHSGEVPVFHSNFLLAVAHLKSDKIKCISYNYIKGIRKIEKSNVSKISIGEDKHFPFVVWLSRKKSTTRWKFLKLPFRNTYGPKGREFESSRPR